MKIAAINDRLTLIVGDATAVDVETASAGRFSSDIQAVYGVWSEFKEWAASADLTGGAGFSPADLGSPTPAPRQIFAIGLNYAPHAAESGFAVPEAPVVFTKFASCITGPYGTVAIPAGGHTDWEAELVVVIGTGGHNIAEADAWSHVAGLTLGQDLSERITQAAGPAPQFGLGKSFPNYGPTGPVLVTADSLDNRNAIQLGCSVNGVEMQNGNTDTLIFSIESLISRLSAIVTFYPGDIIFTGTPAGVGLGRSPQVFLNPGDVLTTWATGIGEMRHEIVAA